MGIIRTFCINYLKPFFRNFSSRHIAYLCTFIGLVICIIFVIVISSRYCIGGDLTSDDMAQTGQVGDFIGGVVGSVWALAGVFLYFSAIRLQTKELSNQARTEKETQYLNYIQQFESSYFKLLDNQHNIRIHTRGSLPNIKSSYKRGFYLDSQPFDGLDYFFNLKTVLFDLYKFYNQDKFNISTNEYNELIKNRGIKSKSDYQKYKELARIYETAKLYGIGEKSYNQLKELTTEFDKCKAVYFIFFLVFEQSISHYCRHMYNIIKYVDLSKRNIQRFVVTSYEGMERRKKLKDINEKFDSYIAFLQSFLSVPELTLLFYNTFLYEKARKLCVKYQLFENLQDTELIHTFHKNLIPGLKMKSTFELFEKAFYIKEGE